MKKDVGNGGAAKTKSDSRETPGDDKIVIAVKKRDKSEFGNRKRGCKNDDAQMPADIKCIGVMV